MNSKMDYSGLKSLVFCDKVIRSLARFYGSGWPLSKDPMARTIGSSGPKTMEAIRKAGLRLIFEHVYAAMSLRQLAAEVGIQAGSLYNHISTKQELLFDLIQDHINEL